VGLFTRPEPEKSGNAPTTVPYRTRTALTASAQRIHLDKKTEVEKLRARRTTDKWQSAAWEYYDLIPEIKYAANLISNVTSRVRLYAAYVTDQDLAPSDIQDMKDVDDALKQAAKETLRLLETGNGGIPGILRDAALNLFVAGECYLVREPAVPGDSFGVKAWQIRSTDEIVVTTGRNAGVAIKETANARESEFLALPPDTYFGRIWRTHPRYSAEADSSLRGMLELCDQLLLYARGARGVAKSRLNAGILFLPDELSNMSQSDGEMTEDDPLDMAPLSDDDSDAFEEELMDAASTPISDESSASSVVPLIVRGPAEVGEKIRHITFDRSFDPQISKDAERTLERILAGLDIPKDVVAGLAGVKYSNAILIEESLYKAHIEPLVLMIVDALTIVLMRPVLKSLGFTDEQIARVVVWYDPSAITTKPDKATAATQGFEMQTISAQAWRRANGFTESDKPSELEVAQRLAVQKGLISEPVMEALLYTLIPDLLARFKEQQQAQTSPETAEAIETVLNGGQADISASEGESTNEDETGGPAAPPSLIEP
jgi:hypothetical protein